ncbi:MAG: DnaJ C-terminal domain-containing protein [Gammaproteobacteria bacterium]
MEYKDYYKIMGLKREATQDELKQAYRKLARKYHPDVSKESDAEVKFKEVGEAYEVLKDPEKRAAYDRLGANWKAGQDFQSPPNWDSGFEFSGGGYTGTGAGGFSDFFESLFGGGSGRGGPFNSNSHFNARAQDHHSKVEIDLADTYHGQKKSIRLQSPEYGEDGHVRLRQRTLNVKIPIGVQEGQQIRLVGQGAPSPDGKTKGDLYLEVCFKPHPFYRVEGRNLSMSLPVSPWEAALGATIKMPTPGGMIELKIPAHSNSGTTLRLKGRGIPGEPAGDIYVTLSVMVPNAENEQMQSLYEEMARNTTFNPRAKMGV